MGTIGIGIPLVILSVLEVGAIYCQKFDTADVRCKVVKSRSAAELESSDCVDMTQVVVERWRAQYVAPA